MSLFGRFLPRTAAGGTERRTLESSAFVPPPAAGVIDDFVGVHRALANMTVLACVRLLADTIASLPWKAYRRDAKGIPKEVKPQPSLITQPYPGFDLFEWKWMVVASMALRGNSYHYVTSRDKYGYPTALLPLHPDIVFLERRPDILMWFDPIYRVMGEAVAREDMVHMRRFTLPGEPWGLSPVRQAAIAIGMGLSAEEFGYRYFKESASPSGLLTTDSQDLDPDAIQRLQMDWIQSHGGRRLPAFLTGGFKWQNISITPEESQFLETRQFQRSEICLMYGVPPILIGDTKECVVAGTLMTMADGTRKVVENLHVGDRVMAWDGSKLVASPVKWIGTPPVKPIVKVTTVRGRELICTSDHPVLGLKRLRSAGNRPLSTDGEWIHAGNLECGQYVRIGLGHLPDEVGNLSSDIGYFLGSMVGDGHIRLTQKHQSRWANTDPDVIDRMNTVVESLGGRLVYRGNRTFDLLNSGYTSAIGGILEQSGLTGTHAHDKFVPDMIMAGGPSGWKSFLSGYFDADGCISVTAKQPHAHFGSASRELLEGCQHLLALLGINSSIYLSTKAGRRLTPSGSESDCLGAWQLRIKGRDELAKLAAVLDIAHPIKKSKLANLKKTHPGQKAPIRSVVFEYDRVKNIEHLGPGQSVGIEIGKTHTHVTNGIISHNTTAWGTGVEQITLGAVTYTFRPWTGLIESCISSLLPRGQFVRFDYNALLRGDVETRYKTHQIAIASGFKLRNEVRAEEEMDPVQDGDILYVPSTSMPVGYAPTITAPIGSSPPGVNPSGKPSNPGTHPMPPVGGGEHSPAPGAGQRSDEELGEIETRANRQLELTKQIRELQEERDVSRGAAKGALTRMIRQLGAELEQCIEPERRATELDRLQAEIRSEIGGVASTNHGKPDAMLSAEEEPND